MNWYVMSSIQYCSLKVWHLRVQAEAERRLGQAKRAAPAGRPGPSPSKRHKPAAVSSDEELSDQEGSEPEGSADMGVSAYIKQKLTTPSVFTVFIDSNGPQSTSRVNQTVLVAASN